MAKKYTKRNCKNENNKHAGDNTQRAKLFEVRVKERREILK